MHNYQKPVKNWNFLLHFLSILRPENHPLERVDERASAKTMLEQN